MKKILFALSAILLFSALSASEVSVTYSPDIKSFSTAVFGSAIVEDRMLTLRRDKGGYTLFVNDAQSLNLVATVPVINKKKQAGKCLDKVYEPGTMITLDGTAYLLVTFLDKKKDENILYAHKLTKDGQLDGNLIQLATIKIESKSNRGSFRIELSVDRKKLVVVANPSFDRKSKESFGFTIFDAKLNTIKKMKVDLPYEDENFTLGKFLILDNGNVYIMGEHVFERKEKVKGQDASEFVIVSINISTEKTTDFKIKVPNRNITSIGMDLSKDQSKIYCLGFYSDIDKKSKNVGKDTDGVFNLMLDTETNEVTAKDFYEFTVDFVNELLGKSKKKAKKSDEDEGIANSFEMRTISPLSDGSFWATFENHYTYERCNTNSQGKTTCRTYYVFGDIIACKVDANGKISKVSFLEKSQTTVNQEGSSSFITIQKDDKVFILYNDDVDNINEMKDPTGYAPNQLALFKAELMPDGTFKKSIVKRYEEDRRIFVPRMSFEIDKSTHVSPYFFMPKGGPCACFSVFTNPKVGFVKIQDK